MSRPRMKLSEMEKEKLDFYSTIYINPRWELIYNYAVEGKSAKEMSELEK